MLPRRGSQPARRRRLTVDCVLHPVGSLPPRVYWKRRLAGVGVVLLLAIVPALLLTGGGQSEASGGSTTPVVRSAAQTPQLDLVPAESLSPSSTPPSTPGPSSSAGAPSSPPAATSALPTSAPPTSAPPTSAPPASAPPPAACTDDVVAVTAGSTQPQWTTAAKPVFLMTITNAGTVPCTRDVGASQQEWGLFAGERRLWGSNDCQVEPASKVQTLQPGQQITVQVEWSGLTSEPSCQQPRERLAAGEYQLRARLGQVQSGNFTVVLR